MKFYFVRFVLQYNAESQPECFSNWWFCVLGKSGLYGSQLSVKTDYVKKDRIVFLRWNVVWTYNNASKTKGQP